MVPINQPRHDRTTGAGRVRAPQAKCQTFPWPEGVSLHCPVCGVRPSPRAATSCRRWSIETPRAGSFTRCSARRRAHSAGNGSSSIGGSVRIRPKLRSALLPWLVACRLRVTGLAMLPATQGSVKLFRLAGITVYVHWLWLVVAFIRIPNLGGTRIPVPALECGRVPGHVHDRIDA